MLHASSGDGAGAIGDGAGGAGATGDGAGGAGATGDGAGGVGATRLAGNSRVEGHDGVEHESKELNELLYNLEAEIATLRPERRYKPRTCSTSEEQADIRRELASFLATEYDDGGGDEYNALAEDMEIGSHKPEETAAKEAGGAHGVVLPDVRRVPPPTTPPLPAFYSSDSNWASPSDEDGYTGQTMSLIISIELMVACS